MKTVRYEYLTDCRAADATYPHPDEDPDPGAVPAAPAAPTAATANSQSWPAGTHAATRCAPPRSAMPNTASFHRRILHISILRKKSSLTAARNQKVDFLWERVALNDESVAVESQIEVFHPQKRIIFF